MNCNSTQKLLILAATYQLLSMPAQICSSDRNGQSWWPAVKQSDLRSLI